MKGRIMYKGTTPTFTFTTSANIDLTQATGVYVTFSTVGETELFTKTGADLVLTEKSIEVYLTQEETLAFPEGIIKAQINWTYSEDGKIKRCASDKMTITALSNLADEVL